MKLFKVKVNLLFLLFVSIFSACDNATILFPKTGFVNAYEAVKLAATLQGERNNKKPIIINSKIVNKKKG